MTLRAVFHQTIVDCLTSDTHWVLLHADRDGVLQMETALADYSGLDSIQVISHGSVGALYLGSTVLNQSNLSSYQSSLRAIGSSLMETGDLLLYGCNVAQGEVGQASIDALTTAHVSAQRSRSVSARAGNGAANRICR